jgi:hypothetical protein
MSITKAMLAPPVLKGLYRVWQQRSPETVRSEPTQSEPIRA